MRLEAGSGQFINCNFGKLVGTAPAPSLWGTPTYINLNNTATNAIKGEWVFTDCNFGTPTGALNVFQNPVNPQYALSITNKDASLTAQERYTLRATVLRDNATANRSRSSIRVQPLIAGTPATRTFSVSAPNNTPCRLVGYLRYDSTYGSATPPSVTLSGLGITPQSYTAGGSANTWYLFDLSATQTSGNDGNAGTSTASPWQTIAKVNTRNFVAGDRVFFAGGQTFTNPGLMLDASDTGTAANPIVIGSYGTGRAIIRATTNVDGLFIYNTGGVRIQDLIVEGPGVSSSAKSGIIAYCDLTNGSKLTGLAIANCEGST